MSGALALMLGGKSDFLPTTVVSMVAGTLALPGTNPEYGADYYIWGRHASPSAGSLSPNTIGGFTIANLYESIRFSSNDGSYSGSWVRGFYVQLSGTGSGSLRINSFTSLVLPGGTLNTASTYYDDAGAWSWGLAAGASPTPVYITGSGSVTFTT